MIVSLTHLNAITFFLTPNSIIDFEYTILEPSIEYHSPNKKKSLKSPKNQTTGSPNSTTQQSPSTLIFNCSICKKSFSSENTLQTHLNSLKHQKEAERKMQSTSLRAQKSSSSSFKSKLTPPTSPSKSISDNSFSTPPKPEQSPEKSNEVQKAVTMLMEYQQLRSKNTNKAVKLLLAAGKGWSLFFCFRRNDRSQKS